MKNPEHRLNEINSVALTVLKMSYSLDDTEDLQEARNQLKQGLRQTLMAQLLADHFCIAVSGIQGVGKSTLVSMLYDIDDFLPNNLGQGELLPILITEDKSLESGQARAFIRRLSKDSQNDTFKMENTPADIRDVWDRSRNPQEDDLLIQLNVPYRYGFPKDSGFLLLPGWQPESDELHRQQQLTHLALLSAARCIFVIDPAKDTLASQHQLNQEIQKNFQNGDYLVALTHSDIYVDRNEAHRIEASKRFNIPDDRIVCVGTFDSDDENTSWKNNLIRCIQTWRGASSEHQILRVRRLKQSLEYIRNAIAPIARSFDYASITQTQDENDFLNILTRFERSANRLRASMDRSITTVLGQRAEGACKILVDYYHDRPFGERAGEAIKEFFSGGPDVKEFYTRVENAWRKGASGTIESDRLWIMNMVIKERLGILQSDWPIAPSNSSYCDQALLSLKPPQDLSIDIIEKMTCVTSDISSDSTLIALHWLTQSVGNPQRRNPGEGLEYALELLPVLMMEYHRQLIAINGVLKITTKNERGDILQSEQSEDFLQKLRESATGFPQGTSVKMLFSSIGAILGIDIALDGNIDSLESLAAALHGAARAPEVVGAAVALSTHAIFGAVAIVSLANIVHLVASDLYRVNMQKKSAATAIVHSMVERLSIAYLADFDQKLEKLREVLGRRLEKACELPEKRSRQLNAKLAIERLNTLCGAIIGEIDTSVRGLQAA